MNFILVLAMVLVPILVIKAFVRVWFLRFYVDYRRNSFRKEK